VDELGKFLKQAGFRGSDLMFIPCSAFHGENLVERKDPLLTQWYCGPTLIELINNLKPPPRPVDMPLRMCVTDIFKTQGMGSCVAGRVEAGVIQAQSQVAFKPGDLTALVKAVERHGRRVKAAKAGDSVTVALSGSDLENIRIGSVLCDIERPIPMAIQFLAQIATFDIEIPITIGFQAIMYFQSVNEPVTLTKLLCTIKKSTGEVLKKKPRAITKNHVAVVQVECQRPVCMEVFNDCKPLGRFTLRDSGNSIAAGTVMRIVS